MFWLDTGFVLWGGDINLLDEDKKKGFKTHSYADIRFKIHSRTYEPNPCAILSHSEGQLELRNKWFNVFTSKSLE